MTRNARISVGVLPSVFCRLNRSVRGTLGCLGPPAARWFIVRTDVFCCLALLALLLLGRPGQAQEELGASPVELLGCCVTLWPNERL
jgi:hypothetical protein